MTNKAKVMDEPSKGGVIGACIFWGVAGVLSLLTISVFHLAGWEWLFRGVMVVAGAGIVYFSLRHESSLKRRGLTAARIPKIIDSWTFVHTTAGLVMGALGIPFPLVALFTAGWELYEYLVPGFGDTELMANRIVDIAVAWVGWIIVAGIVAALSQTAIPWLLPSTQSVVRDAVFHLF